MATVNVGVGHYIPEEDFWFIACLLSETNRAQERPWVAAIIFNRMMSRGRYPSTTRGVVLQRKQFSYFNRYWRFSDGPPPERVAEDLGQSAIYNAYKSFQGVRYQDILPPRTYNFWSPVSMQPQGSLPKWDFSRLRCFTAPTVDPWRFVFAETVSRSHPLAGNHRQFDFTRGAQKEPTRIVA